MPDTSTVASAVRDRVTVCVEMPNYCLVRLMLSIIPERREKYDHARRSFSCNSETSMSALIKFDQCSDENLAAPETCSQAIIEIHRVELSHLLTT